MNIFKSMKGIFEVKAMADFLNFQGELEPPSLTTVGQHAYCVAPVPGDSEKLFPERAYCPEVKHKNCSKLEECIMKLDTKCI